MRRIPFGRIFQAVIIIILSAVLAGCGQNKNESLANKCDSIERLSASYLNHPTNGGSLLIGDSITWMMGDREPGYINRGVPGNTITCAELAVGLTLQEHPKEVIIAIGINDIHAGLAPSVFAETYRRVVDLYRAGGVSVFIRSVLPAQAVYAGQVRAYNDALLSLATAETVTFLDTYKHFAESDGSMIAEYTSDGTHLNAAGYEVYREHFLDR